MKKYIYSEQDSNKLLRIEEAVPECGDYCDRCGECLACFGGDECWNGSEFVGEHFWVEYEDEQEKNHAELD